MNVDSTVYGPTNQPHTYGRRDDNLEGFIDNWPYYSSRLMVFLGAGASIGAVDETGEQLPAANGLRDDLWCRFMVREHDDTARPELGLLSLEHSTALIESKVGRGPLVEYVGKRFTVTKTLWPHSALPFFRPKAVFTTNYDELIELGWACHAGMPPITPVFSPAHLRLLPGRTPLFKPHGTAQHAEADVGEGGIVLTQFDYFAMLEGKREMLTSFFNIMAGACVVFIGYSFQDMDVASLLYALRSKEKKMHWYAVFPRNDANVRAMYDRQYGIKQISRTFSDFVAEAGGRLGLLPTSWQPHLVGAPRTDA